MKVFNMKKIVLMLLCSGFIFELGGASLMASEGVVKTKSENPLETGRLFYIGEESVTIGDQGYAITPATHYQTKSGGVTTKSRFHVGDEVEYLFDPGKMTIIELRIKEAGSESDVRKEKEKRDGKLQFKDGVWTN